MSCSKKVQNLRLIFDNAVDSLNCELRTQVFTHVSYSNEQGNEFSSNERLEFLGDAVISLVVGLHLYQNYPRTLEGDLTRTRASLVSGASLAEVAKAVELGQHLILGRGENLTGGRCRPRILAGALEAVFGAYFLQHGWERSRKLVESLLLDEEFEVAPIDPKTLLQEILQKRSGVKLEYKVLDVEGPDHRPLYTVACLIDGKQVSTGKGRAKKEAEEDAARNWLIINRCLDSVLHNKDNFSNDRTWG